jgi:Tol biopolymer transport system component
MKRIAGLLTRATISLRPSLKRTVTPRTLAAALAIAILLAISALPALAGGLTPPAPIVLTPTPVQINVGPGGQTDPHISGTLVSYTDNSSFSVAYYDFVDMTRRGAIPHPADRYDSLSDVSGSKIAFMRASTTGSQNIYVFDVSNPGSGVQEVDPQDPQSVSLRRLAAIGNDTIAWEDGSYDSSSTAQPEITVYDAIAGIAIRLTNNAEADMRPAVSADGNTVAWVRSPVVTSYYAGEIYYATRSGGWTPVQLTGSEGNASLPDTNGAIVVYGSNAGGDDNIRWQPVGGGTESWLDMPGVQRNPNISGDLIAFESSATPGAQFDIFVYDVSQGLLYQLTDTSVSESLSDISVGADGKVRVVWAQSKQVYPYDMDVYGLTFDPPPASLALTVQPLFDQTQARRVGSVFPIRLQLLDAQSNNISSPSLVLTVTGLVQKDGSAVSAVVDDAGNANPDSAFRYDETLGGYAYNLSTKGMATGTWELQFTVSGDSTTYRIGFDLR